MEKTKYIGDSVAIGRAYRVYRRVDKYKQVRYLLKETVSGPVVAEYRGNLPSYFTKPQKDG